MAMQRAVTPYLEVRKELLHTALDNLPPVTPASIREAAKSIEKSHAPLHERRYERDWPRQLMGDDARRYQMLERLRRYGNGCTHGNMVNDTGACMIGWTAVGAPSWALGAETDLQKWFHKRYIAPDSDSEIDRFSQRLIEHHIKLDGTTWGDYYASDSYQLFATAALAVAQGERLLQKAALLTVPVKSCFTPALAREAAQRRHQ